MRTRGQGARSVDEPRPLPGPPVEAAAHLLVELVAAGGRIGRAVNYYDGPKVPRTLDGWRSLEHAVAAFHGHLVALATSNEIDLAAAVDRKLRENAAVDAGRFALSYDPRTAPILARFAAVRESLVGQPVGTRLFGAPEWIDGDVASNLAALAGPLRRFVRAAPHEQLDGFVVGAPEAAATALVAAVEGLAATLAPEASALRGAIIAPANAPDAPGSTPNDRFILFRAVN